MGGARALRSAARRGQVLFQADYLMKEMALGEYHLPGGVRVPCAAAGGVRELIHRCYQE